MDVSVPPKFTRAYDSGSQVLTAAGALTLAHGLGVRPSLVLIWLRCTTAEVGYAINDETLVFQTSDAGNRGIALYTDDAVNVRVRFGSANPMFLIPDRGTGAQAAITIANWRLIVRAWA